MKKAILYIMALSSLFLKVNAQEISEKDNSLIDDLIKSKIFIQKEKIVSDTLAKVFNGTFFKVDAGFSFSDESGYCSGDLFIIKDGECAPLGGRSDSMHILVSLVRPDFYIKSEVDARIFETALDKIYPIGMMGGEYKEHLKINTKWYFIRDKFFDSKSGYIVTLDKNSKISNIGYSMEAIKK